MRTCLKIFLALFLSTQLLYAQEGPRTEPGPVVKAKSLPTEVFGNRDFLAELSKHIGGAATEGNPEGFDTTVERQNLESGLTKYRLSFNSIFMPVTPSTTSSFGVLYNENVDLWSRERIQVTPDASILPVPNPESDTRELSDKDRAVATFKESKKVQRLLKKAEKQGYEVSQEVDAALLSGTCGVAGCSSNFLVTQALTTRGVNPQTRVVAAVVTVGLVDHGTPDTRPVRVLSEEKIWELVRK